MGDDIAVEQQLLEFAVAPSAVERGAVQRGKGAGIAGAGFGQAGLAACKQAPDELDHRRGRRAASWGWASGARR